MRTIQPTVGGAFDKLQNDEYLRIDLGNGSSFRCGVIFIEEGMFIGVEGHGAYTFSHFAHESYVGTKLNLRGSDATNIADFINTQIGYFDTPQGTYLERSCKPIP